jgi:ADP-ribose pyrophosphatase YjhB (NUDIX family)
MLSETEMRFCPRCGHELADRMAFDKKVRRTCDNCGFIHFRDPKVAVAIFIVQDDSILLVKRAMQPGRGKWALPAGFVDYGEDPREAAVREVEEETGLKVRLNELVDVLPGDTPGEGATIVIVYSAEVLDGALTAADDVDEAVFFEANNLPELAFASTQLVIDRWLADHKQNE